MKRFLVIALAFLSAGSLHAQHLNQTADTNWTKIYRATYPRINDLVHTKLDVKFDYAKSYLYGKAWISLKPHFYPTDSLLLDAKGMDIHKVSLVTGTRLTPLKYEYNGMQLDIRLNKLYKGGEQYTVHIEYTAKPDELKTTGSAAITDAKGLYFINPRGEEKDKPTQIWTQGETEATSVWCPTIDKPNQKTTQEIIMTVPDKYVTLSNGKLQSQKKNNDGTRTDHWKMELPHAPYLFFMGVGEYAIVKDSYKGKEVSYYVEKEYAPVARKIFGNTPEMMTFFSKITGIDYPWVKYAQIVGRDYVSGAMENTTATLHQESAQQDARELIDQNRWEKTIAHELFHQWFGNLVTAESWSNLSLNESFANYSEVLWEEYKYGKDAADAHHLSDQQGYIASESGSKDLIRFHYADKEDMFDAVSYNKGGQILHMLRNHIGDSAFFRSLNLYLTSNKFKAAEAHHLRLAFEEVTGRDLNWFFNQWYFGSGHPTLDISYVYNDNAKTVDVLVKQTQAGNKIFQLPFAIDIYNGAKKTRHQVWMDKKEQTFTLPYQSRPDLVNVDGDKILLAEKKDDKTLANYIHQYKYAGNYIDRREAIDAAATKQDDPQAVELLKTAVTDKYYGLRSYALGKLDLKKPLVKQAMEAAIADIAKNDKKSTVRATAIGLLSNYNNDGYKALYLSAISDSSYSVAGAALEALAAVDEQAAITSVRKFSTQPVKGQLAQVVSGILIEAGREEDFDVIYNHFKKLPFGQQKLEALQPFAQYLGKVNSTENLKKGVDEVVAFREGIPAAYKEQIVPYINNVVLGGIVSKKTVALKGTNGAEIQKQIDYIRQQIAPKKS
jgi:aminopeptidase N